jgi:hypothetical protein
MGTIWCPLFMKSGEIMDIIFPSDIIKGTFSIPKNKQQDIIKGKIQRISIKEIEMIQVSLFTAKQVFHENVTLDKINDLLNRLLDTKFNSLELFTENFVYGYKISSKGKLLTNKRATKTEMVTLNRNKQKKYILNEGEIIPPMIDLGVMTQDGKIVKAKSDKFKQINRFLEIVDDVITEDKYLKIIDFGCGKSYLTFIIYYYLTNIRKINCDILGLDLKEDVVKNCNKIAEKYGYSNLKFLVGDISKFKEDDNVDMIITLHACDTATDYALYHAINMKCKHIISVPCCQHEINNQLSSDKFHMVNKFGILKERMSAILTDAIRANILQYKGYKTQVLEFVDFDASPKNLLIRANLTNQKPDDKIKTEIDALIEQLGVEQTLYNLIFNK